MEKNSNLLSVVQDRIFRMFKNRTSLSESFRSFPTQRRRQFFFFFFLMSVQNHCKKKKFITDFLTFLSDFQFFLGNILWVTAVLLTLFEACVSGWSPFRVVQRFSPKNMFFDISNTKSHRTQYIVWLPFFHIILLKSLYLIQKWYNPKIEIEQLRARIKKKINFDK